MKKKYYQGDAERVDQFEKEINAIDKHIESGRLVVDHLRGTAAMDSYLWIYYTRTDKMMQGFCMLIRQWINFQRSWKKGELLRMIQEGSYDGIRENELKEMLEQQKFPIAVNNGISPTNLSEDKIDNHSDEQKRRYLEEYVNARYCLWPNVAPILVACVGNDGKVIASVEQTQHPSRINFNNHGE